MTGPRLSRRELFAGAGAVAVVAAVPPLFVGELQRAPVISLHADEPFLDLTGTEMPYHGRIATDWAASLDDEALIRLGHFL